MPKDNRGLSLVINSAPSFALHRENDVLFIDPWGKKLGTSTIWVSEVPWYGPSKPTTSAVPAARNIPWSEACDMCCVTDYSVESIVAIERVANSRINQNHSCHDPKVYSCLDNKLYRLYKSPWIPFLTLMAQWRSKNAKTALTWRRLLEIYTEHANA